MGKYTYPVHSDTRLKQMRANSQNKQRQELITEILELRRTVKYLNSLVPLRVGGNFHG